MQIHPLLRDPQAVFVQVIPPANDPPEWDDYRQAAFAALDSMHICLEDEKAALKPNVTSGERFANPDSGVTTHPGFLHGMIDYLRSDHHANRLARRKGITIIEDPRDTDDNDPRHWRGTGYDWLSKDTGVPLHCPTTYTVKKVDIARPMVFSQLKVSRLAVAPGTALFNVPKLKTHNLGITTLGLKNLMGLVNVFDRHYCAQAWQELPEPGRSEKRPRQEWMDRSMHELWQAALSRRLVDTAQALPPALTIIEGIVGREGTGFQNGRNRALGMVVAGTNLVAVDAAASYLMGFDPLQIVYLSVAAQAGLGTHDVTRLRFYTTQDGDLRLCTDVQALRADPFMRVITWAKGEDNRPFDEVQPGAVDVSAAVLNETNMFNKEKLKWHST
jgi:uncharacterized protein (DUF362 family)